MNWRASSDSAVEQPHLILVLVTRWKVLGVCVFTGLLVGMLQVALTDVAFRADATVAPVIQRKGSLNELGSGLGIGEALGLLSGVSTGKEAEQTVAKLVSNHFTYRFVVNRELAPELFPERWDAQTRAWRVSGLGWLPFIPDEARAPTQQELIRRFSSLRAVSLDRQTELVRIRLDWSSARRSAELVNSMIADFNDFARAQAGDEAHKAATYLAKELESTSVAELRHSLANLMEEQMTREMMAAVQPEFALRVVDPAVVPDRPVRPRYVMMPILWVMALLMLAVALIAFQRKRSRAR